MKLCNGILLAVVALACVACNDPPPSPKMKACKAQCRKDYRLCIRLDGPPEEKASKAERKLCRKDLISCYHACPQ